MVGWGEIGTLDLCSCGYSENFLTWDTIPKPELGEQRRATALLLPIQGVAGERRSLLV